MNDVVPPELLRRQYLQMMNPDRLALLSTDLLCPQRQSDIYESMFNESNLIYPPPERYRFRVLKKIVTVLEAAIEDPEEDEISNEITSCLAQCMASPLPPLSIAAQEKCHLTYTAPFASPNAPHITLLEAPSLLASAGTTGFRTWEAALKLGCFLFSSGGKSFVLGKNVLELGAGTGFISILCAKHLNAAHVLATDGSAEVIADLKTNITLNGFRNDAVIKADILQWGNGSLSFYAEKKSYDLAIGADVIYDIDSIPALVATILDLFGLNPAAKALISVTIRNEDTLAAFLRIVENELDVKDVAFVTPDAKDQTGFFFPTDIPIKIFELKKLAEPRQSRAKMMEI